MTISGNQKESESVSAQMRQHFIDGMRDHCTSVTVVTTDGPAGRHGATVSAFTSVSADPPTVLVCLNAKSRIAQAVQANHGFCVNLLPTNAHELSSRFAGFDDAKGFDRFDGLSLKNTDFQSPAIAGCTHFMCKLLFERKHATHLIMVGQVLETDVAGITPLTYLAGQYRSLKDLPPLSSSSPL